MIILIPTISPFIRSPQPLKSNNKHWKCFYLRIYLNKNIFILFVDSGFGYIFISSLYFFNWIYINWVQWHFQNQIDGCTKCSPIEWMESREYWNWRWGRVHINIITGYIYLWKLFIKFVYWNEFNDNVKAINHWNGALCYH